MPAFESILSIFILKSPFMGVPLTKYRALFAHIEKHIALREEDKTLLSTLFSERVLHRKEVVLNTGDPCRHIYFLNSGLLRAFFLNPKGKEYTVMFAMRDWWITDMHCYLNELPAMVSIEAVEEAELLCLTKADMDRLFVELPAFNLFFRKLMEKAYCREQLRSLNHLSQPALERYRNFQKNYPELNQKLTVKQIASYLGITPEFLSSLRAIS
jgi:CRP-like cAMP-binding protein